MNKKQFLEAFYDAYETGNLASLPLEHFGIPEQEIPIEVNNLLQKLHDIRVLRSSCSESHEGEFRIHLPEKEWDEIQELVKMLRVPVSPLGFHTPYTPLPFTTFLKKDDEP